jgi:hypothetical protein
LGLPLADTIASGGGSSAPDMESEVETTVAAEATSSPTAGEVTDQDPATSSSSPPISPSSLQPRVADASASAGADDNIMVEPEAILGHPPLRAPGDVSLDEVIGTVH